MYNKIRSDTDEEFLFDLQDDPFELTNSIADPALDPVLGQFRAELAGWIKSISDRACPAGR